MELLDNITQLTDFHLDLSSISIHGIQFGDSKESIPSDVIPQSPYFSWQRSEKGFSIRFSETEPHPVIEFLLRPAILEPLQLRRKKDVQLHFGPANAIEKRSGNTLYFYEHQRLIVSWDNDKDTLWGIYLGDNILKQTRYSIQDFLKLYHEFKAMTPDMDEWHPRILMSNEPRYYRLLQLQSLMKAFNLGVDLRTDFQQRGFLKLRSLEDFRPIYEDIEKYVMNSESEMERDRFKSLEEMRPVEFQMLLQSFFRFSEEMRNIKHFNSGWLEAGSVSSRYSIHKTAAILNTIDNAALDELNEFLYKIMDPKNSVFTKSDLIELYDFPDVDLDRIDLEYY